MFRFKSITGRIIALHVIAISLTSIFMPLAIDVLLNSVASDLQRRSLTENANQIVRYLTRRNDGDWKLDLPPALESLYSQTYGRYAYAILDSRGIVLFSSTKDRAAVFPEDNRSRAAAFFEKKYNDGVVLGASFPKTFGGHTIWVQVSQDLAHRDVLIDDIVRDFFWRIGWIIVPILLFLLAIDVLIFRRALRPLFQASAEAESIGPTRIDVRLPLENMPSEIVPVVRAVNQALDRLEQGYQSQRDFTADAAHELRTPLSILRMRIDSLGDHPASGALRKDVAGMQRILSQLLEMAELESFTIGRDELADLNEVCAGVAELVAPLALAQRKEISLTRTQRPLWINGNPEMLSRAVRNLVDNAMNYAPEGTAIYIVVAEDGAISVLDRGPGIKPEERELVFRRFWRKDRIREGSAGLGLSIVQRITQAHGGTTEIRSRNIGGAEFILRFKALTGVAVPQ